MIGNNSAGAHSLTYGKTLDHVIELTVFLADGSEAVLKDLVAWRGRDQEPRRHDRGARLSRSLPAGAATQERNSRALPEIMRRVCGYNLDELVKPQPLNLARLIVGSEGTLAPWSRRRCAWCRSPRPPRWT